MDYIQIYFAIGIVWGLAELVINKFSADGFMYMALATFAWPIKLIVKIVS